MRPRSRGLSVAEVLVYSFLAGMVGLLMARFLSQYNFIASSFNTRNALNTAATQLFANLATECENTNARGVQVSTDGRTVSVQKISSVDSLARMVWAQELDLYWYDADADTVCFSELSFSDAGLGEMLYAPQALSDEQRTNARQFVVTAGKVKVLARHVTECRFEKPAAEELFVRMTLSQKARGERVEVAERQHSFLLMSDREI